MAYTTIKKPSDYFETTTYTGGATDVSSLSFQPDFVWAKKRDGAENHGLFDAVRGATKTLNSNTTSAESTRSGSLTSFDSDGWSMGGSDGIISASGSTYVAWSWSGAGNSGSANTDGSISSTVSANTTSGFSIVKWSGTAGNATVGHGLGAVPKMIIFKNLSDTYYWVVYHQGIGNTAFLSLNEISASSTSLNMFQNTTPTSSVFSLTSQGYVNGGGGNQMIAYCFADVQGYSKFGRYTGNGNADGTFVYTGFSPAFVMIKQTNGGNSWEILDNKRNTFNTKGKVLFPDSSQVEYDYTEKVDFLSNGFKLRSNAGGTNSSGASYIYMAFAEQPLVGDNPATAR